MTTQGWFSLGAINNAGLEQTGRERERDWQAANDGLNFKPLTWAKLTSMRPASHLMKDSCTGHGFV